MTDERSPQPADSGELGKMGRMGRMPTQAGSGEEREGEAIHVRWDADDFARVLDAVKAEGDVEGYRRAIAEMSAVTSAIAEALDDLGARIYRDLHVEASAVDA